MLVLTANQEPEPEDELKHRMARICVPGVNDHGERPESARHGSP